MSILNLQRRIVGNLTYDQRVATDHPGLDSLPGFVLVVFERGDRGGATFYRLLNSGENLRSRIRIPFVDLSQKYFAIAVNDSVLSYAFAHPVVLQDGSEEFTLNFHLTYRVIDHKKVAELFQSDPLRQLRDEVARVISRNCAKRKAEMFRDRFRDLERIVIDSESVRLRPYATELGFKIISIDLDKPITKREKGEFDKDGGPDRSQPRRKLQAIQTDAARIALTNVGSNMATPEALQEAFEVARSITVSNEPVDSPLVGAGLLPENAERAGGGAETRSVEGEVAAKDPVLPSDVQKEPPPINEIWRSETARLFALLEQAGADVATTARLREGLDALEAEHFQAQPGSSEPVVTTQPHDVPVFDAVMCSVFTPPVASGGASLLVQVFAHRIDELESVRLAALEFDNHSRRLMGKTLDHKVKRTSTITFSLSIPGLEIDEPVQELVWYGHADAVQFSVHVPESLEQQEILGTVFVSQEGVPFGHAKFLLRIMETASSLPTELGQPEKSSSWKRYEYAFISYATTDRSEVLKRVQMLPRFHIDFFQDLLTLEPGQEWEKQIYENIDRSDVFLLFWSSAARDSEWVMREVRYALNKKCNDRRAAPEIVPVIIEGPPPVPPPDELKDIHFNDRMVYFMNS